jgi:hypothetical protein
MEWLETVKSVIGIGAFVMLGFYLWSVYDDFNKDDKDK